MALGLAGRNSLDFVRALLLYTASAAASSASVAAPRPSLGDARCVHDGGTVETANAQKRARKDARVCGRKAAKAFRHPASR